MSDGGQIQFVNLGPLEYERAKKILNAAKHPRFVGRELFFRCATTGVACVAVIDGEDCGVALVAKQKLQALSVPGKFQGKGVGSALMRHLVPRWVGAIAEKVAFFKRLGYEERGAPNVGQNGKHATQLMELVGVPDSSESGGASAPIVLRDEPVKKKQLSLTREEKEQAIARTDERVREVMGMMSEGTWASGRSHLELALKYDVTPDAVRSWANAASRHLRMLTEGDEVRAELCAAIEHLRRVAADSGDVRSALQAIELRGKFLGMFTTKIEDVTPPPREQLWESVRAWLANPSSELIDVLRECGWVRRGGAIVTEGESE